MATDTERCIFRAFGQDFILNKHFHLTGKIGRGSHSLICSSTYTELNEETHVAIRKIPNAFGNKLSCKRTLRELKLLRHLRGHPNIVWLFDTDIEVFDFRKVVRKHPISGDSPSSSLSLEDAIPQEVVQVHPSRKVLPSYSPEFSYVSQLPSLTTTQPYQNLMGISSNSFQGVNEKENTFKQDTKHENSELLNGSTEPNITKMGLVSSSPPGHDINVNDGTNQNTNEDDSDFFFDLEKELELFRR
ncbi:BFP_1a_G0031590.mRNA.1.CDS.1 [Saccharomyces cerevisiae]|nr:BFP_1a_G0031590.mRNA.1.CDS.1 [Saccharomyces cerevisiae]CAI7195793.1 BFP_1a_G0031590.mRNA.1.CDS.1 [Saccharomyces cerevisiae]